VVLTRAAPWSRPAANDRIQGFVTPGGGGGVIHRDGGFTTVGPFRGFPQTFPTPSVRRPVQVLYFAWVRQKVGVRSERVSPPPTCRRRRAGALAVRAAAPGHAARFANAGSIRAR
jgi:hypothetical protein